MKTLYYLTLAILIGLPAAASAHGPTRQKVEETITITAPTDTSEPRYPEGLGDKEAAETIRSVYRSGLDNLKTLAEGG